MSGSKQDTKNKKIKHLRNSLGKINEAAKKDSHIDEALLESKKLHTEAIEHLVLKT